MRFSFCVLQRHLCRTLSGMQFGMLTNLKLAPIRILALCNHISTSKVHYSTSIPVSHLHALIDDHQMDAMSSPITGMPTELIAACLSRLDNLRWFSSALISHRLFHTAYTEQPSIVIEILKKQIPSALLPFALAVHNSAQRPDHDQGFVSEVLDELYLHAGSAPVVLSKIIRANLSDAVRISQMHSIVQVYCEKFGAAAFEDLVGLCGDHLNHESVVLSSGESFRIMRAFYRAEIFWRLFARGIHDFEPLVSNIQNGFFDRHSPWVNEQLACVHDFLERELSECKQV